MSGQGIVARAEDNAIVLVRYQNKRREEFEFVEEGGVDYV